MSTNKIVLRSIDELMNDYVPVYKPIFPLLLGKSQQYNEEVGKVNFKRLETVGDVRAHHILPKDSEIREVSVKEASKTFKKYFLANEFAQSALQDRSQVEDVVAQVLDEHQRQMDELVLLGEGTSDSTMINNGLFWSGDSNYVLEGTPSEIFLDDAPLMAMHGAVVQSALKADLVAGRKLIMFYGDDVLPLFRGLHESYPTAFKKTLSDVLGANFSFVEMPADVTPTSTNGWIVVNLDQVKLHYTSLPSIHAQGVDERKMEVWTRFLMGSSMVDVLALNGIVRQPATVAASDD